MAMRKRRRELPVPNGSAIVWMAGVVLGAGAGIVLVYHMLLASHAAASTPLAAPTAIVQPATLADAPKAMTKDEIRSEHAQALQDAMQPAKS